MHHKTQLNLDRFYPETDDLCVQSVRGRSGAPPDQKWVLIWHENTVLVEKPYRIFELVISTRDRKTGRFFIPRGEAPRYEISSRFDGVEGRILLFIPKCL